MILTKIKSLEAHNIRLFLSGSSLRCRARKGTLNDEHRDFLKTHRAEIIDFLRKGERSEPYKPPTYLQALEIHIFTKEQELLNLAVENNLIATACRRNLTRSLGVLYAELAEARAEGRDYFKEPGIEYPLTAWNKHIYSKAYVRDLNYVRLLPDGSSRLE